MPSNPPIRRALLSVSDKTNIVDFAAQLQSLNIEILSTGGTAKLLREHKVPVIDVSDYTGFPEIMSGRVKTLHPKIHGAILGRRDKDANIMAEHKIMPIDLVAVNLYPFETTIANPNCSLEDAIENIDIGGPTLLRAAAKNYTAVTVLSDTKDYSKVLKELSENQGATSIETRFELAKKAFIHTARYDSAIATYLGKLQSNGSHSEFSNVHVAYYIKKQDMRYGENPHQKAAFYVENHRTSVTNNNIIEASVATAQQLQGKPLSFNNIADADAALECVKNFSGTPACVIVKHANPCGVAIAATQIHAYQRAFTTDPTSAFGGIIALNLPLEADTAQCIMENQFAEVIIAPEVKQEALAILSQKPNIRVLSCGNWAQQKHTATDYKRVTGGLLVQERDSAAVNMEDLQVVTQRSPTEQELQDLLFAWKVAKYVKSNAIVYAKDRATIGIGAGQMSRIDSAKIAAIKAASQGLEINNAVLASDAFFPFRDSIDTAAQAGIKAIIQPGGSIRDNEVIAAANQAGIAMVFTGIRHFRH